MLSICDTFGKEFDVIFNTDKNQLLYYGSSYHDIPLKEIKYNNISIPISAIATHLGHCVGPFTKEVAINNSTNAFTSILNGINKLLYPPMSWWILWI